MATNTTSQLASATSAAPSASSSHSGGSNGPSSPLLFFVALGFGVVFTNLWIIVGVKYCFRYNQRNRARLAGEDQDAVDLGAMPRQHRRRREKKLMTIDEVNEKFPLTKYKTWRSNRAEEGLPTAGGITTDATSRPASIRESKDESRAELSHLHTVSTVDEKQPEHGQAEELPTPAAEPSSPRPKTATSTNNPPDTPIKPNSTNDEEDEDDDHIQTAVPAAQLPDPGDACAICIDTIEDDDDVRGLHCGHAFHASCVDPWLTSRRACCPLCKADYYTPKPRTEAQEAEENRRRGQNPTMPPGAFMIGGRRPTMVLPGRFMSIVYDERDRYGFPRVVREPRPSRAERRQQEQQERDRQMSGATMADGQATEGAEQRPQSNWRQRLPNIRMPGAFTGIRRPSTAPAQGSVLTPAQVEEGRAQS